MIIIATINNPVGHNIYKCREALGRPHDDSGTSVYVSCLEEDVWACVHQLVQIPLALPSEVDGYC